MIYTASQFRDELDVLLIRLETIGDMVDKIVLAEATVDQRGRPKPLIYPWHQDMFAKWYDKIEYIVVDDMPGGNDHADDVARERWQRDALIRGMPDLQPDDRVYVSDLDEIPTPEALEEGLANAPLRFAMDLHLYALNWRWLDRGCRIGTLGAVLTGESILRQGVCGAVLWDSSVKQRDGISGWHLTYQGGVQSIHMKITGMMDKAKDLVMPGLDPNVVVSEQWIQESINTGRDIFGRTYRNTEWVDIDQMPPVVQEKPDMFRHMMVPRPEDQDLIEAEPRCSCGGAFIDGVLEHFTYCQLGGKLPDMRNRPRSEDV